jgi:hypothetical protein
VKPRNIDKSFESHGEGQTPQPRQAERKRRFQIVKLEERIAPGGGSGNRSNQTCGNGYTCHCTHFHC